MEQLTLSHANVTANESLTVIQRQIHKPRQKAPHLHKTGLSKEVSILGNTVDITVIAHCVCVIVNLSLSCNFLLKKMKVGVK